MQLRTTLVQGAANAFIQGTINTGLSVTGNQGYRLDQLTIETSDNGHGGAGFSVWEWALSRASKAAMPTLADDDVLIKDKFAGKVGTDVGWIPLPGILELRPEQDIIIIEDVIYGMFKTLNLAAASTVILVLDVSPVKVTTDERIAILQSRIN